jgi:DNA-binding SARP family transcriptional activator
VLRPVSTGAETLKGGRPAPVEPVMMIYGLGPFQVYLRNRPVENWVNRKARAIFKYLILNHTKPVPKEVLMDCFWAESDAAASRNNLNVAVYNLRQTLHQIDPDCSHILFQDDAYYLNPDLNTWIDFEFFREQFQRGQRFERAGEKAQAIHEYTLAEALYHGPLFEDDRYEEWLDSERKGLENAYQCILNQLSEYYLEEKNYAACMATCNKMLLMDSCWDEAHQRLMQCYDQQGQYYLALRQYHLCVENYQKELETQPSAETTRLYEQIRLR